MPVYQALILGAVQGLTELWPISSTAHLALIIWLFDWGEPQVYFIASIHLGTLLAILVLYYKTAFRLLLAGGKAVLEARIGEDRDRRMAIYILIALVPALVIGIIAKDAVSAMENMPILIIIALLCFSFVLLWIDRRYKPYRRAERMGYSGSLAIGVAQILAFIPGVSRSGATISAGMLEGLTREDAVEFSFLLSLPTIAAASAYSLLKMFEEGLHRDFLVPMLVGIFTSMLFGMLAIKLLLRRVRRKDLTPFIAYRIAISLALLVVFLLK